MQFLKSDLLVSAQMQSLKSDPAPADKKTFFSLAITQQRSMRVKKLITWGEVYSLGEDYSWGKVSANVVLRPELGLFAAKAAEFVDPP